MSGSRTPAPRDSDVHETTTGFVNPLALCQSPGFGFGIFLHGLKANMKAPEYMAQSPFYEVEVCCMICVYVLQVGKKPSFRIGLQSLSPPVYTFAYSCPELTAVAS